MLLSSAKQRVLKITSHQFTFKHFVFIIMVNKMADADVVQQQKDGNGQHQETIEALTKEAEQLKARLEEERSKLSDVDCMIS